MTFFARQLAIYASYHRDQRNRITHLVGIPAIILSLTPPLALWQVPVGSGTVSGAWIVAAAVAAGWIALDASLGAVLALVLVPLVLAGEWIAGQFGAAGAWWTFAVLFAGGWAFQILGHAVYEKRRPALIDNILQAYIGPMFIAAEVLMALGWRRDLHRAAERQSAGDRAPV